MVRVVQVPAVRALGAVRAVPVGTGRVQGRLQAAPGRAAALLAL
jgi:hypothetical protein